MKPLLLIAVTTVLLGLAAWAWTPDRPWPALEAAYLRAPADRMEVDGQRLHVRDDGPRDAPALLLLHGLGASLHTWEPWAESLAGTFRVVRVDLPGHGLSPPDARGDYSDERSLQFLTGLLDALGLQTVTVVGNSIGGRIAWRLAAAAPQRVERLVLIAPDGFASPGFAYGQAPQLPALMQLVRWVLPPAALRLYLAPAYPDPTRLTDGVLRRYHDLLRAPGARAALLARIEQTVLPDPAGLLPRIAAPTLLIWGEQDALIPISNASDYLRLVRDVRLARLPGAGHVPHEEAPAASLAALRDFLSPASR